VTGVRQGDGVQVVYLIFSRLAASSVCSRARVGWAGVVMSMSDRGRVEMRWGCTAWEETWW